MKKVYLASSFAYEDRAKTEQRKQVMSEVSKYLESKHMEVYNPSALKIPNAWDYSMWDWGWYWGCGYIETFTNNKSPELSRDIQSHSHFDSMFLRQNKCVENAFNEFFADSVLTKDEVYELCDYMMSMYKLKNIGELFTHGCSWQTERAKLETLTREDLTKEVNEKMLPELFNKIRDLLTK